MPRLILGKKKGLIILSNNLNKVIGYIHDSNGIYAQQHYFDNTPENIANFITQNNLNTCTITDMTDNLILKSTVGGFVDVCYDQHYLTNKLLPVLIPLQLGDSEPVEIEFYNYIEMMM